MTPEVCSPLRGFAFTWAWALCLALVLRALVPAGYMPDFRSGSMPGVVLCGMQTPGQRAMAEHDDHSGSGSAYDNPLHFVAQCVGGAPLPIVTAPVDSGFLAVSAVFPFAAVTLRVSRVCSSPLGSRAPPRTFA